jgi:hypothetical protein
VRADKAGYRVPQGAVIIDHKDHRDCSIHTCS